MQRTRKKQTLSQQMQKKINKPTIARKTEYDGGNKTISTGSTLLDLAISGGRFREGGIPIGILVEIFGPSGAGKTVLLSQIAGNIQKGGGKVMFHDPEARLDTQFAKMFGLVPEEIKYTVPNTIPEVFQSIREWGKDKEEDCIYGVSADSLAALSTDMEMEGSDKYGMRRAKEFSEELRKTCRIITQKELLVVCSNQIRVNIDAGMFGQKYISPGGEAIGFYSSLRLKCSRGTKLKVKKKIKGKDHERTIGIKTDIEVYKSSVWKPYHNAEVYILFDYGIDDIRANLKYLKTNKSDTTYKIKDIELGKDINTAITNVEEGNLEQALKDEVIDLWNEIESTFNERRKPRL